MITISGDKMRNFCWNFKKKLNNYSIEATTKLQEKKLVNQSAYKIQNSPLLVIIYV